MTKSQVTNAEVAARIGLTPAGVSRLRTENGDARRTPSYAIMKNISDEYGWDITEQNEIAHFGKPGEYARTFEEYLEADALKKPDPEVTIVDRNEDGTLRTTVVSDVY